MSATVFRNARIIDGTGDAPFSADVRVVGNRIAAIERDARPSAGDAADVVDCAGATLMPGLIEPHAHLSFVDQATPQALSAIPVEEHVLLTLKHAKLYLDQGFTSCFSAAATKPRLDIVARNAIDRGEHPGPRLKAASVQFTVTGGVGDLRQMHLDPGEAMYTLPCDGPVEFRRAAREACREGVDVLKIVPSGDTSTPAVPSARHADDRRRSGCRVRGRARAASASSPRMRAAPSRSGCACATASPSSTTRPAPTTMRSTCSKRTRQRVFVAPALSVTCDAAARRRQVRPAVVATRCARGSSAISSGRSRRMKALKARGVRVLPGGDYGFMWNPHGANARDLAVFRRSARLHADGSDRRRDEMGRRDHGHGPTISARCAKAILPTCCSSTAIRSPICDCSRIARGCSRS